MYQIQWYLGIFQNVGGFFPYLNIRKLLKLGQEVQFVCLFSHFSNSIFEDQILKTFTIFGDNSSASELQRMPFKSIQKTMTLF